MDEFPNLSEEEINRLRDLNEDELYIVIGQKVPIVIDGRIIQPSSQEALAWGKDLVKRIKDKLKQKICIELDYCNRRSDPMFEDLNELSAIILPLLPHGAGLLVALAVASLLLKWGLNKFCGCKRK